MFRFVLVILTVAVAIQGTEVYEGRKFAMNNPMPYEDAAKYCEYLGMKLMVMRRNHKILEILDLMDKEKIPDIWLGIRRDPKNYKKFLISSVHDVPALHTFFMPGEPADPNAKCVRLVGNRTNQDDFMRWAMGHCNEKKGFICETI